MKRTKFLGELGTLGVLGALASCSGGEGLSTLSSRTSPNIPSMSPPAPSPTNLTSSRWWGVTIDNLSNVSGLVASLSALKTKPIARICFDAGSGPGDFSSAISAISPVAYIMGQLFDSQDVPKTSLSQYASTTSAYLSAFPNLTAWEVGNEINGEWLSGTPSSGSGAATGTNNPALAKAYGAWQLVRAAGKKTALTLYYEPSQTVTAGYDMIGWAQANMADPSVAGMAAGLDYVLVSYYETDNDNIRPTLAQWTAIFQQLEAIFPNSYLGFGEVGMSNPATGANLAQAENIMQYYYGLAPAVQNWIGGFFWWYFAEDCVPRTAPLWGVLNSVI